MEHVPFGGRRIGAGEPVAVIAEIGVNHEGDAAVCARMIEEAAAAGADSIKLQTIDADENYVRGTESHELFSRCSLSREDTARMFELARRLGMEPFTTAGDPATLDWVTALRPAAHKISSGLLTNHPAVRHAARSGLPLLMSTGMAEVGDIDESVAAARGVGARHIGIFQCTSIYPAPPEALNLATIRWLEARYEAPAGYSDHSVGVEAAALAVAAGARMIEKHFTFDCSRKSYDHRLSLEPVEFAKMVRRIREAETMLGRSEKCPTDEERRRAGAFRRIVVARRSIAAGERLDEGNVALKRPLPGAIGVPPSRFEGLLGRVALRAIARDEPIGPSDFAPPLEG